MPNAQEEPTSRPKLDRLMSYLMLYSLRFRRKRLSLADGLDYIWRSEYLRLPGCVEVNSHSPGDHSSVCTLRVLHSAAISIRECRSPPPPASPHRTQVRRFVSNALTGRACANSRRATAAIRWNFAVDHAREQKLRAVFVVLQQRSPPRGAKRLQLRKQPRRRSASRRLRAVRIFANLSWKLSGTACSAK